MPIVTLTDLNFLLNQHQLASPLDIEQQQFQLIMKQTCLKLPTEPFLNAHPQINKWIKEVQSLFPELFRWQPPQ